jgi:hypothetical protein
MIPSRYTASSLRADGNVMSTLRSVNTVKGQIWVPCRPMSWPGLGLVTRIKLAFGVFIGRYDVLDWEEDRILKAESEYAEANNPPAL